MSVYLSVYLSLSLSLLHLPLVLLLLFLLTLIVLLQQLHLQLLLVVNSLQFLHERCFIRFESSDVFTLFGASFTHRLEL